MAEGRRAYPDVGGGHIGLAVTIIALVVIVGFSGTRWALITVACFAAWFIVVLTVVLIRGGSGRVAVRRAYVATFGWGDYITP
ncbi:hypothetical protein [Streptomyces parvulus]|uniref:Uncharacterized protein n=1 Tax=Streptomyces parvulus TaxID=146923 RepID=A0A369V8H7_9ACTN|nr:hypothetical protein [Streptomyces parvulus]RDD89352.1 hypothetical protein DVZ84_10200 [Streptomyces parvulus]